jgi:hypothetical protein
MVQYNIKRKKIHDLKKGLLNGSEDYLDEAVALLEAASKAYAPVDTGFLRGSIFSEIKKFLGKVISPASYSKYQEFGKRAANGGKGFMKPAADLVRTKLPNLMAKHIRKGIRRS